MRKDYYKTEENQYDAFGKRLCQVQVFFVLFVFGLVHHLYSVQVIDIHSYRHGQNNQSLATLKQDIQNKLGEYKYEIMRINPRY